MSFWKDMPRSRLLVEASLWSADFTRFADEIRRVDPFTDLYHIDVADGHFTPGLLFFADLIAALRPLTKKPFHVHLMTTNPLAHIDDMVAAGADLITVHAENGPLVPAALSAARKAGAATGLALGLDINPESVVPYLGLVDLGLMMGTPMGIKGVEPSPYAFERMRKMKSLVRAAKMDEQVRVFADGGIREHTVPGLYAAGADGVITGSLVFKSTDMDETFAWLHNLKGEEAPIP